MILPFKGICRVLIKIKRIKIRHIELFFGGAYEGRRIEEVEEEEEWRDIDK